MQRDKKNGIIIKIDFGSLFIVKKLYDKIMNTALLKKITAAPLFAKVLSYEILSYLFFGVMTTVVNFVVFYLSDKVLGNGSMLIFPYWDICSMLRLKMSLR